MLGRRNIWQADSGVFFGYEDERQRKEFHYTGDRHLVTLGPNGSGKSRRLLLPNLESLKNWSIVVIDPKGELRAMTEKHRRDHGSEIVVLDPFGKGSTGHNPIQVLDPQSDDFVDDALGQAEANIKAEGRDPHWGQAAQEWLSAVSMYVRLVIPNGSYADVRALLGLNDDGIRSLVLGGENTDPRQLELFEEDPKEYRKANPHYAPPFRYKGKLYPGMVNAGIKFDWEEIGVKASRFGDITPDNREIHSVMSTALTQTRWLDSRPVKRDLAKPPFDFSVLKQKPVTVYLILPARRLATHATWLRLMITSILQVLMKDTRRAEVPVMFMLDEFAQLGHLPIIEDNLAMLRGYGIKLWAVFQDLSQAQAIYGNRWESFIANSGVLQSFAAQDTTTAEYISRRTGQTTKHVRSTTESRNLDSPNFAPSLSMSESVSQLAMPLMLPQEIRDLQDGESILFTHQVKGTVRTYLPFPSDIPRLRALCVLDPAL